MDGSLGMGQGGKQGRKDASGKGVTEHGNKLQARRAAGLAAGRSSPEVTRSAVRALNGGRKISQMG